MEEEFIVCDNVIVTVVTCVMSYGLCTELATRRG